MSRVDSARVDSPHLRSILIRQSVAIDGHVIIGLVGNENWFTSRRRSMQALDTERERSLTRRTLRSLRAGPPGGTSGPSDRNTALSPDPIQSEIRRRAAYHR